MALDLPLPNCVYAHSFWISEGKKMSKSLGNFIDLEQLQGYMETYGRDALRYYLAAQGPLGSTDADFSRSQFHETYTTDLVNTFGNCASRTSAMIGKYCGGRMPEDSGEAIDELDWPALCETHVSRSVAAMGQFDLAGSIDAAMGIVRRVDAFINDTAPFKLAKQEENATAVAAILYRCAEAIRIAAGLLEAILPDRVAELRVAWNLSAPSGDLLADCRWGGLKAGTPIAKVALFPRIEA